MATRKKSVGRLDLVERIHSRQDILRQDEVKMAIEIVLTSMARFLAQNKRIEIRGFGSFTLRKRPERMGRNPKTGELKLIATRYTPHFKASRSLSASLASVEPVTKDE